MDMKGFLRSVALAVLVCVCAGASAFTGSVKENGKKYYLYNLYQSKFLTDELTLSNVDPQAYECVKGGFTVGGKVYSSVKNSNGSYQLKNSSKYLQFVAGNKCEVLGANNDRAQWLLVSEEEYAKFAKKKKVTFASLNVDGMPKSVKVAGVYTVNLNPDAKEGPGATAIGQGLLSTNWDVIGVSEDFNFHSQIWDAAWNNGQGIHYNATTHRGSISAGLGSVISYLAKKPIFDTDGLGLFFRIEGDVVKAQPSQETWVKWNEHYGYDKDGADGLINKGYRYYLITLADGVEIDLYIMHMDAETSEGDNAARETQIVQLVDAVKATNNKRPIIIMGDTNCRYTRDRLKTKLIDVINADERFTIADPWIEFGRGGVYPAFGANAIMAGEVGYLQGEVVDKLFYINNEESNIRLVAESYCQDLSFINEEGEPLADHWPCVVTFSYYDINDPVEDENPTDTIPTDTIPTDTIPSDTIPNDTIPGDSIIDTAIKPMNGSALVSDFFSLSGAKRASLKRGINIVRGKDGKVKKIFVK